MITLWRNEKVPNEVIEGDLRDLSFFNFQLFKIIRKLRDPIFKPMLSLNGKVRLRAYMRFKGKWYPTVDLETDRDFADFGNEPKHPANVEVKSIPFYN